MTTLVGKYVLTGPDDEKWSGHQGEIVGELADGYYLVQWFSWLDGSRNSCSIVDFEEMLKWDFYIEHDVWVDAANRFQKVSQVTP